MKNLVWMMVVASACGVGTADVSDGVDDDAVTSESLASSGGAKPRPLPALKRCSEDKECGAGNWCDTPCAPPKACALAGVCRALPTTCGADADCPERHYCDDPCAPPRVCAAAAQCRPVPPPTACSDDSACASGYHCELPCGPDGDCVPLGTCVRNKPAR